MKQYRGYYIDNAVFSNADEIDAFIKENTIRAYKTRMELFSHCINTGRTNEAMAISADADSIAQYLVNQCGMTWDEIEQIELETIV